MIIAISIATLSTVIATGLAIFFCIRKRQNNKDAEVAKETMPLTEIKSTSRDIPLSAISNGNVAQPSEEEFKKLVSFEDNISQRFTTAQGERYNKSGGFNRNPEVLPFDHNRVKLRNPVDGCDYVNATWISKIANDSTYDELIYSSYVPYKNIKFIVGQNPLPVTLQHHYAMVHENRIDLIICFTETPKNKPLKVGKNYHFKDLTLTVHNRNKVQDELFRSEISIFNIGSPRDQYRHYTVLYEYTKWPKDDINSSEDTQSLVSAMVLIRQEMDRDKSAMKILTHDSQGGLRGSALFLVLYDLMQKIDEGYTENNKVKTHLEKINIFNTVNKLRKDRAGLIDTYATYKLLHFCLEYYGLNRCALKQLAPLKFSGKSAAHAVNQPVKVVRRRENDIGRNDNAQSTNDMEVEYVLHENSDSEIEDIFDGYYD